MAEQTISDFMARMNEAFIPEKAVGVEAVIRFEFTGAQAADWYATIKGGQCNVTEAKASAPNLTITADADDFVKIFSGQLDGMQAFMQGKLRVSGDMGLAMKLMGLFRLK
jgi:putative sterol carrier protein